MRALETQVGGSHYLKCGMQPFHFSGHNQWDSFCHTILKYLTRWRDKGGLRDLEKARHVALLRVDLDCEAPYPPDHRIHKTIPMGDYLAANNIPAGEDVVFYALEGWVQAGRRCTAARVRFIDALDRYIEAARIEVNGEPEPTLL